MEEELKRFLGVRQNSYTHEKRMNAKFFAFRDEYASARAAARKAHCGASRQRPATAALERSNARIEQLQRDFDQFRADLVDTVGVPAATFDKVRKATGAAKSFPRLIMTDNGPESERSKTAKVDRGENDTDDEGSTPVRGQTGPITGANAGVFRLEALILQQVFACALWTPRSSRERLISGRGVRQP